MTSQSQKITLKSLPGSVPPASLCMGKLCPSGVVAFFQFLIHHFSNLLLSKPHFTLEYFTFRWSIPSWAVQCPDILPSLVYCFTAVVFGLSPDICSIRTSLTSCCFFFYLMSYHSSLSSLSFFCLIYRFPFLKISSSGQKLLLHREQKRL